MSTSHGQVNIQNDEYIDYQDNSDVLKRGTRKNRGKGDLVVQTSNDDVYVAFDIK